MAQGVGTEDAQSVERCSSASMSSTYMYRDVSPLVPCHVFAGEYRALVGHTSNMNPDADIVTPGIMCGERFYPFFEHMYETGRTWSCERDAKPMAS